MPIVRQIFICPICLNRELKTEDYALFTCPVCGWQLVLKDENENEEAGDKQ